MERGPSSMWDGVIWFCETIRLSGHNSEPSERVSHTLTPAGGQEKTVCDCRSVVSRERRDGNV